MVAASCETVYDMTGHAGMLLAIANVGRNITMPRLPIAAHNPDAAVLIDSPTLHLPLREAQAAGVPVMYYTRADIGRGAYRIHGRAPLHRVAVIFQVEEEYFRNQGVSAVRRTSGRPDRRRNVIPPSLTKSGRSRPSSPCCPVRGSTVQPCCRIS